MGGRQALAERWRGAVEGWRAEELPREAGETAHVFNVQAGGGVVWLYNYYFIMIIINCRGRRARRPTSSTCRRGDEVYGYVDRHNHMVKYNLIIIQLERTRVQLRARNHTHSRHTHG